MLTENRFIPFYLCLVTIHYLVPSCFAQLSHITDESSLADTETSSSIQDLIRSSPTITELDTSEPYLWQMAAFAARQMSTKQEKFKLTTLTSALQIDSSYRLKVTLQRMFPGQQLNMNVSCHHCKLQLQLQLNVLNWDDCF